MKTFSFTSKCFQSLFFDGMKMLYIFKCWSMYIVHIWNDKFKILMPATQVGTASWKQNQSTDNHSYTVSTNDTFFPNEKWRCLQGALNAKCTCHPSLHEIVASPSFILIFHQMAQPKPYRICLNPAHISLHQFIWLVFDGVARW